MNNSQVNPFANNSEVSNSESIVTQVVIADNKNKEDKTESKPQNETKMIKLNDIPRPENINTNSKSKKKSLPVVSAQTNSNLPIVNKTNSGLNFTSGAVNLLNPVNLQYLLFHLDGEHYFVPFNDTIKVINNTKEKFTLTLLNPATNFIIDITSLLFKRTAKKNVVLDKSTRTTSNITNEIEEGKYKLEKVNSDFFIVKHEIIKEDSDNEVEINTLEDWKNSLVNIESTSQHTGKFIYKLTKLNTVDTNDYKEEVKVTFKPTVEPLSIEEVTEEEDNN